MSAICVIPARGGSKRLPSKNKKLFHGKPIIAYPIKAALDSGIFSDVIVSSDSPEILNIAIDCGARGSSRPAELAVDSASEIDAYLHVLSLCSSLPEYFCALYATAAFVTAENIQDAYDEIDHIDADVCMGVTKFQQHPYQMLSRSQKDCHFYNLTFPTLNDSKYPEAFASNGSLYFFRTETFLKNPTYYPEKLTIIEAFNIDINNQADFERAEREWKNRI